MRLITFLRKTISLPILLLSFSQVHAQNVGNQQISSFDLDWKFMKDSTIKAEIPRFNDVGWRKVDLPHDWSIEDLPHQKPDSAEGPFQRTSIGKASTGFTVGGTGWYRKKFILGKAEQGKLVSIHFDGVYMNADVWLNGHHLGNHPYGYTAFEYNLTPFLKPMGQENQIAIKVRNEGKNSRWYSGSGIYRHVWLKVTGKIHVPTWGVYVTTPEVSAQKATVRIASTLENKHNLGKNINLTTMIVSSKGKIVGKSTKEMLLENSAIVTQEINLSNPDLWSIESPVLYKVVTEIKSGQELLDHFETPFGIRSLQFDAIRGFELNGKRVLLKGGCIHHDNGPLGAAVVDRAEERKIELLKKVGYNAIRASHNPPSKELLDACDRLGMLFIDEAFDMWENPKNPSDYHLYFKQWWKQDLQSMVLRDRNHPSVIMWSIGNEIYEAPDSSGYANAQLLAEEVRRLDSTRPVTEAFVFLPPYTKKSWEAYEPHLKHVDIDGYNYFLESKNMFFKRDSATERRFDTEHVKHPKKVFMVTEYLATAALENWDKVEKYPYVIGSFKWTAMDYIGEAGIGRSLLIPKEKKLPGGLLGMGMFYKDSWPVFNAYCGDLDLIGNRKAASFFQDVVWRRSPVEILVHRPIPEGMQEAVATWGFPDEVKSWTWPEQEGKKMQVSVYTRSKEVRLELNGEIIARQIIPDTSITASFQIDYHPGTLIAKTFDGEHQTGVSVLSTTGKPVGIRLVPDRKTISPNRNDLSYVSVEVIDEKGNVVPYVSDLDVSFQISGDATIAAVGNGNFDDVSSFQQQHKKVFQGKGLVIIRPRGVAGKVILTAKAQGLKEASTVIFLSTK